MQFDKAIEHSDDRLYKAFVSSKCHIVLCPSINSAIFFLNVGYINNPYHPVPVSDKWMISFLAYLRGFTNIEVAFYEWTTKQELTERAFLEMIK